MAKHYVKYGLFLLKVVIYPWFIFSLLHKFPYRKHRAVRAFFLAALYLGIGLPLVTVISVELVIKLDKVILGRQWRNEFTSDFSLPPPLAEMELPGDKVESIPAVEYKPRDPAYYRYLAEEYSPVILHEIGYRPGWDIPVSVVFDGTLTPRDNVANAAKLKPNRPLIYGGVTAETDDSFYLTYSLYHIKDYDHPVREAISSWTYHDGDNEGFMIRVNKRNMQVAEVSTWLHNRFLFFNRSGRSTGTEKILGRLNFENKTHVVLFEQNEGHGARCAELSDLPDLHNAIKIMRFRKEKPFVTMDYDSGFQDSVGYTLEGFEQWHQLAAGPLRDERNPDNGFFENPLILGSLPDGSPMVIGRFFVGGPENDLKNIWVRPKPMWSWDDVWDDIPIAYWYFLPAKSFESHTGSKLSNHYIYNAPSEEIFHITPEQFEQGFSVKLVKKTGGKWKFAEKFNLDSSDYFQALFTVFKKYVNRVFIALG